LNVRQLALAGVAVLALGGTAVAQGIPHGQIAQTQVSPPPPPVPNGNAATPAPDAAATPVVTMPPQPTASPSAAPEGRGRGHRGGGGGGAKASPEASDTPEPPQFQTMTGVWEVQMQPLNNGGKTIYSHLYVTQSGDQLTGYWIRNDKKRLDFTGTFDGRLFKLAFSPAAPTPPPAPKGAKGKHGKTVAVDPSPSPVATGALQPTAPGEVTFTMSGYAENFGDMVGLLTSNEPNDQGTPFTAAHRKKEKQAIGVQ
jgi:hypothetical protein